MTTAPVPTVTVKGADKAAVNLRDLGDRGSDIRRVSEKVRSVYRKSNLRHFDGDNRWKPLAPLTVERKAREGLDPRTLRASGALLKSLTAPRASGQVDVREKTEFRFGTSVPYAQYQNPTRDLIDLSHSERRTITDLISAYVAKDKR